MLAYSVYGYFVTPPDGDVIYGSSIINGDSARDDDAAVDRFCGRQIGLLRATDERTRTVSHSLIEYAF